MMRNEWKFWWGSTHGWYESMRRGAGDGTAHGQGTTLGAEIGFGNWKEITQTVASHEGTAPK